MTVYFQIFDTEANAWAGDYGTLDEALTAVRDWADHDGDAIADDLVLCRWSSTVGEMIAEGSELLRLARQSVMTSARTSSPA